MNLILTVVECAVFLIMIMYAAYGKMFLLSSHEKIFQVHI